MVFRKKDEVKKKKQTEMAQKYPMQNPRTNVVAVVTKKEVPALVQRIANTHTEAQQANAAAHEAQAEQVGQIGKQVLQKGKVAAEEAWKQQAEIQNRNSVQQIRRGKTQADAAMKAGKTAMQQAGALALAQANVQKTLTDTISNVYTDFFSNPNWGKTVYETSGVTGSDQTGASVYGYRNDTHSDKHDEEYNRAEKQKRMDALSRQLKDKEVLAGEALAARVLSVGKILDGYNSMLEHAATGKISSTPNITPGEYSQIVDDTIANRIAQKGDPFAADVYRIGTKAIDDISAYAVAGPIFASIRSAAENATESLNHTRNRGVSDKKAVEYAFLNGAASATVDAIGDGMVDFGEHSFKLLKNKVHEKTNGSQMGNILNHMEDVYLQRMKSPENRETTASVRKNINEAIVSFGKSGGESNCGCYVEEEHLKTIRI